MDRAAIVACPMMVAGVVMLPTPRSRIRFLRTADRPRARPLLQCEGCIQRRGAKAERVQIDAVVPVGVELIRRRGVLYADPFLAADDEPPHHHPGRLLLHAPAATLPTTH